MPFFFFFGRELVVLSLAVVVTLALVNSFSVSICSLDLFYLLALLLLSSFSFLIYYDLTSSTYSLGCSFEI